MVTEWMGAGVFWKKMLYGYMAFFIGVIILLNVNKIDKLYWDIVSKPRQSPKREQVISGKIR